MFQAVTTVSNVSSLLHELYIRTESGEKLLINTTNFRLRFNFQKALLSNKCTKTRPGVDRVKSEESGIGPPLKKYVNYSWLGLVGLRLGPIV